MRLYADDLKLVGDPNNPEILEHDLECLSTRESDWDMNFYPGKCTVIHIEKDSPRNDNSLNGNRLRIVGK
jgi:hypothetical protein